MSYCQVQNVSNLVQSIKQLDGTESVFPHLQSRIEQSRIEAALGMQNTLDTVKGTLPQPKEDPKPDTSACLADYSKGYNPKDIAADWDALLELACSTIRWTLTDALGQRYQKVKPASHLFSTIVNAYKKNTRARRIHLHEEFWNTQHDPNKPIALWIGRVWVAANNLLTVNKLPTDRQIADRLVGGLDPSWSNIRDSVVYTAMEMSLENTTATLEAHEVSLNGTKASDLVSASAANTKRFGCSNCSKQGHCSPNCPKPKNYTRTKAGAATAVKLGDYNSDSHHKEDEINVIYE
ncbi:hypothetical protein PTTG_26137 [Puccinia triticina 1-1 BBBD Race 1]|uniref:CCHC-type domain-containing protein n=1 Tax=Puccinia triticina (isolate 1-1 / race 1 (BBBD)) TaxID=630390 RepID=A0A180GW71_PUCT1|nr:hypothetical protein PTTG_26137 [Puccinia triticina 1-1 BBBD Race 1]